MSRIQTTSEVTAWVLERMFHPQAGWEHAPFLSLLEGLTAGQASWRPAPDKRCIWELVIHLRQWRSFVNSRLRGKPVPDPHEPWPPLPQAQNEAERERLWRAEIESLKAVHKELGEAMRSLDPAEPHPHPDLCHLPHVIAPLGAQVHDSYHLGQIAMLRGMQGLPPVE